MKLLNLGSAEAPKWYFVTTVNFNGEEQEIILAFTDYSIKRKNFEKNKTYESIDKSKLLPTLVCLCDAKPFYTENVPLYDYVGSKIENLLDNAPAVMVYLDKADNVNLLGLTDEPLQAELVECDSVADAYRRVATTAYFSQCPSKDEWIGYACLLYTSDAADEEDSVDIGGRRIVKKKKNTNSNRHVRHNTKSSRKVREE